MTIPLKDPKPMTTCPTCNSPVRVDRLEKHIRTKHSAITQKANYSNKTIPPASNPAPSYKKKQANRIVPNSPKGPSATRRLPTKEVRCPFCIWTDYSNELPSHIRISHPMRYAAWSRENQSNKKPDQETKEKVARVSNNQLDPYNVKCPICELVVLEVYYSRHLKNYHPGKTEYTHPPLPVYINHNPTTGSIRRAAGGVKQPIAMSTLNVGRRSKGYIKRK